jgi:hypothetical protein
MRRWDTNDGEQRWTIHPDEITRIAASNRLAIRIARGSGHAGGARSASRMVG